MDNPKLPPAGGYLVRSVGKQSRAHIWIEEIEDTACRMWSTNGIMKHAQYSRRPDAGGRKICMMCTQNVTHNPDRLCRQPEARDEVFGLSDMLWFG